MPAYYAVQQGAVKFEEQLNGFNFDLIPSDAVGIMSESNENPLMFISTQSEALILDIDEKSNNTISLSSSTSAGHTSSFYLGVIVSADRKTIYWINDTKPLPI